VLLQLAVLFIVISNVIAPPAEPAFPARKGAYNAMAAYPAKGLWPVVFLIFSILGCLLAGSCLTFFGLAMRFLALALVLVTSPRKLVQFIRRCLYWTVDGRCRLLSRSLCHVW
jgi:energy-coupling factor transporter transmembrane protein EcfT